jgi:phosphoglycerol transferase MdoB-like AlkP superfamily enzyme
MWSKKMKTIIGLLFVANMIVLDLQTVGVINLFFALALCLAVAIYLLKKWTD